MGEVGAWIGVAVGALTLLAAFARYVVRPVLRAVRRFVQFCRDLRDALVELRELVGSFSGFVAEIHTRVSRLERLMGLRPPSPTERSNDHG